jgi:hypothetical protein
MKSLVSSTYIQNDAKLKRLKLVTNSKCENMDLELFHTKWKKKRGKKEKERKEGRKQGRKEGRRDKEGET